MSAPAVAPSVREHREAFREWLDDHAGELRAGRAQGSGLAGEARYMRELFRTLWDAGFTRWGWPSDVGGLDGPPLLRAVVAEELALNDLAPGLYTMPEVLGAPFAAVASPELRQRFLPRYLTGEDWWCQGFSEPDAGSDLASLRTRAKRFGTEFVVTGQKVWTSYAQFAERCILLVRTGDPESGASGITVLLVDMDSPGLEVRPLRAITGVEEFSELHLNEVVVPADRVVGAVDQGWSVVRAILASERATVFWCRQAWLLARFGQLLSEPDTSLNPHAAGETFGSLMALRARSRATQHAAAAGSLSSAGTSVDKILMSNAEQALYDLALESLGERICFGETAADDGWRSEFLHSRAATIYGGTAEIQRNIVAQRILGLGSGGRG